MKKLFFALFLLVMFILVCSVTSFAKEYEQLPQTPKSNKVVVCFSATDNTFGVAEKIADVLGADLLRIEAEIPYTPADLRWTDDNCRANREQNDNTVRPGIANLPQNLNAYDTVFLGYPIWWGTIPQIIKTFVEAYDWNGKTIIAFCTSGSSGIETSLHDLRKLNSGAKVLDTGRRFSGGASEKDVRSWLSGIGY